MHQILTWLEHPLFLLYNDEVSVAELLGFITGAWCVWLCVGPKVLNFPVGIANNLFFLLIFFDAKLYADGILQIFYAVLGLFGWYAWLKLGPQKTELDVGSSRRGLIWGILASIVITAILWPILRSVNDTAPFWDAVTTGLSLSAQTLLSLKKVQNWWLWMAADIIYVPLYVVKGLALTSGVYAIFFGLCVLGYKQWRATYQQRRTRIEVAYA